MRIHAVTDEREFLNLKEAWKCLLSTSGNDSLYSTHEWLSAWWQCLGQGKQLLILAGYEGERLVALAPFVLSLREGFRQAALMGGRVTDYKDCIIDAGMDRSAVLEAMLHELLTRHAIDFVQLSGLLEDSPNFPPLITALDRLAAYRPVHEASDVSVYVKVQGTLDEYWHRLGRGYRENCKRQIGRLRGLEGGYAFHFPTTAQEVSQYVELMLRQKIDRWRQTKHEHTLIEHESVQQFYVDVAQRLLAAGWAQAPVLRVKDQVASVDFGAVYGGKYFSCQHSFNEEFSTYSVGRLLNMEILRRAYENGWREMDLGLGAEPYKFDYKPDVRKMFRVTLFKTGVRGQAAEKWFQRVRPQLMRVAQGDTWVHSMGAWVKSRML
jgi:CelD/BcsL family acetyltransferase involved in cellulose biosynthesis